MFNATDNISYSISYSGAGQTLSAENTDATRALIEEFLVTFDGPQGRDSLGVPLFHSERLWAMWDSQKRHVDCIQDPENFPLYQHTGSLTKGHQSLPTFRCARGSTSLESFHLHLNRFIPGMDILLLLSGLNIIKLGFVSSVIVQLEHYMLSEG